MFPTRLIPALPMLVLASSAFAQTVSTMSISQPILTDGAMIDGDTLYVTEGFSGSRVHAIDLATGQVSVALSGLLGPIDVAIDAQDRLYATNWNSNEIRRGAIGSVASPWTTVGQKPDGLLFDGDGLLWCTLGVRERIKTVDSSGVVTPLVPMGVTTYPLGIAQGTDGNMYVGGLTTGIVWRVTPAGVVDSIATVPSTGQFRIGHLETAQGVLFASGLSEHTIYKITLAGEVTLFAGTPGVPGTADGPIATATFTSPIGLAASEDGNELYVTTSFVAQNEVRIVDLGSVTDAVSAAAATGSGLRIASVSPNPFRARARLDVHLPHAASADLAIFDLHGRRVRTLLRGGAGAGPRAFEWDGLTDDGRPAPSGVYFARVRAGGALESKRIVLRR